MVIQHQCIEGEVLRAMYSAKGRNTIVSRAAIEDEIRARPEFYPSLSMKKPDSVKQTISKVLLRQEGIQKISKKTPVFAVSGSYGCECV
ncbi:MAG: hypothetical protein V1862_00430 [Methanobacteriota archaeon]